MVAREAKVGFNLLKCERKHTDSSSFFKRSLVLAGVLVLWQLPYAPAAQAQLSVGGLVDGEFVAEYLQQRFEKRVEALVEENVDEDIQDEIEGDIEEIVEDSIDENIEDSIATAVEESTEQQLQDSVEETLVAEVEESVTEGVEASVAEATEEALAEDIEDSVAGEVEESLLANVDEQVEDQVAAELEDSVEQAVTQNLEEGLEAEVEQSLEETVEEQVAEAVEEGVEGELEAAVEDRLEGGVESRVATRIEDRMESEIDEILERIETELEVDERRINRHQWLVMAEPEVFDQLAEEGYLFDSITELPGMGLSLAEVAAPSSFDIYAVRKGVLDVVGSDRAEVDLNHFYTAGAPLVAEAEGAATPRSVLEFPADTDSLNLRIGMIDSGVDTSHPSLGKARIETRSFVPADGDLPSFHGTAIASIIAANDGDYRGLAPNAEVFAAAVFQKDRQRGEVASTVSLVRALDWLIASGVNVVNLSLAGPPNRLLETALKRAAERDVLVLAAAGNGGPVAGPMYPAAYESVVAVTAVDAGGRVYRLANRGAYLDLAAPGVGLLHARAGGGYAASSGTSFAVPFAVTAAARLRQLNPGIDARLVLRNAAQDLGPPGPDEIYGYGLLRPGA